MSSKKVKQPGTGLKYDTIAKTSAETGGWEPMAPSDHPKPPIENTMPVAPSILEEGPTKAPIPS